MSGTSDLERSVRLVLDRSAPTVPPDELLARVLSDTGRSRPRPAWLADLKEPPMRHSARVTIGSPTARILAVLALTTALGLIGAGAVALGASLVPSPQQPPPATLDGLIAYDRDGDIWVVRADGSDPRPLIERPEPDTSPVWSPDGSRLAFWSGTSVVVADATGGDVRTIHPSGSYTFIGDGYSNGNPDLEWGPGPDELTALDAGAARRSSVVTIDLATGVFTPLDLGDRSTRVSSFFWAPDRTKAAFVSMDVFPSYEYVELVDAGSTTPRTIVRADPVWGILTGLDWSPDGRDLAFTKAPDDPAYDGRATGELQRGRADIHVLDLVTGEDTTTVEGMLWGPVWSPDGTRLAFSDDNGQLFVVGRDGAGLRPLDAMQRLSGVDIAWSPDGTRVLSLRNQGLDADPAGFKLVIFDAVGSDPPVLIDAPGIVGSPSWQPSAH
jgi:dipeptidyl aminopeptidase/acylaminoacyl peptidase